MKSLLRDQLVILFVVLIVLFTNLGKPRLWDRDEPRNAGCAREMLQRGDWVVPWFNDELRTHKPVLLYWLMMSSYSVFGVSEFSARFWSALLATGTVLLTYHAGRRLLGRTTATWAASILATFVMFGAVGRAATPDSTLIFCSTAALTLFVYSVWKREEGNPPCASEANWRAPFPQSSISAMAIYGLMGLGVLAKGPVGLVLPTAVLGMFCLIQRLPRRNSSRVEHGLPTAQDGTVSMRLAKRLGQTLRRLVRPFEPRHFLKTCWAMRPLLAICTVAVVAGPWYVWVSWRTGGVWIEEFFGQHNLGRAMRPMEGHDGSFWLYYPLALLVGCFPWSVFALPTWLTTRKGLSSKAHDRPAYVFLSCWVGVYVVIFSLAQTKLPSYVAPTYPALALLLGSFVRRATSEVSDATRRWWWMGMATVAAVGVVMAVGLTVAARRLLPGESSLGLIGLVPVLGGVIGLLLCERRAAIASARVMVLTAAALATLLFGFLAVRISDYQQYERLLARAAASDAVQLGSYGRLEPTWVYYSGRPIHFFRKGQLRQAAEFVGAHPDHYLVVTDKGFGELKPQLPAGVRIVSREQYFLKDIQLLLLTCPDDDLAGAPAESDRH